MEPYESKIKGLKLKKPFLKIWSIFSVPTAILIVWFESFYPFQVPNQLEIKTLVLIRWSILLTATILILATSVGYLLWKIKKLKEPPEPVISPVVRDIINKVIDDKINDKEIL